MQYVSDMFAGVSQQTFESAAPGGYHFYGTATIEQIMNV